MMIECLIVMKSPVWIPGLSCLHCTASLCQETDTTVEPLKSGHPLGPFQASTLGVLISGVSKHANATFEAISVLTSEVS